MNGRSLMLTAIVAIPLVGWSPASANPDNDFASAQALLRQNQPADALVLLSELQSKFPDNVDYAFAAGQALARLGRDEEARDRLYIAIELAPDYEEVWIAQYAVLQRISEPAELAEFQERAANQFPSSTWWQPDADSGKQSWTLLLGAGADDLSNNLPSWNNQFAELQYKSPESNQFNFRLGRDDRGRESDTLIGVGASLTGDRWFGGGSLTIAPDPAFQSGEAFDAYVGRSLQDGWVAGLSGRYRSYETATVNGIGVNIERYFGAYRVAYTFNHSQLDGSGFASHVLTGNWYYGDHSNVGASVSTGREAEAIGGGRVLETDVRSVALTGKHGLNSRVGLHWWLGVHEQGDIYRRKFVGLAVSIEL